MSAGEASGRGAGGQGRAKHARTREILVVRGSNLARDGDERVRGLHHHVGVLPQVGPGHGILLLQGDGLEDEGRDGIGAARARQTFELRAQARVRPRSTSTPPSRAARERERAGQQARAKKKRKNSASCAWPCAPRQAATSCAGDSKRARAEAARRGRRKAASSASHATRRAGQGGCAWVGQEGAAHKISMILQREGER